MTVRANDPQLWDPKLWRRRAADARALVDALTNRTAKQQILDAALSYEGMADRVEARTGAPTEPPLAI